MKLFKPERPTVVRVDVFVSKECKTFTLDERVAEDVAYKLKEMLPQQINCTHSPLVPLSRVTVQCYEHTGSKKGKHKSFSVYGLTVEETYKLFMDNIKK